MTQGLTEDTRINALEDILSSTAPGRALISSIVQRSQDAEKQALISAAAQLARHAQEKTPAHAILDPAQPDTYFSPGARLIALAERLEVLTQSQTAGAKEETECAQLRQALRTEIRELRDITEPIIEEIIRGRQVMDLFLRLRRALASQTISVPFEISNLVDRAVALMREKTPVVSYSRLRRQAHDLERVSRNKSAA